MPDNEDIVIFAATLIAHREITKQAELWVNMHHEFLFGLGHFFNYSKKCYFKQTAKLPLLANFT